MDASSQTTPPGPKVLVVDDEVQVRTYLSRLLQSHGYQVDAVADGTAALALISQQWPDVVLLDIHLPLPGPDGFEICRRVRQDTATRLTPIILITARNAPDDRAKGLDAGADDFLTKPIDPQELLARVRSLVRMKLYTDDLDSASAIITTLATMIEARDGYGPGHCHRMANYASSLGRAVGVDSAEQQALYRGGFLHDIGMLAIPDAVVRKTGPLSPAEFDLIKWHTIVGDELCANLRTLQPIRPIVRWHHERLDGSGYPDGLRGEAIPLVAQIVGVVDVFEAVTSERPYQHKLSDEAAVGVLTKQVQRGWLRSDLVAAFVRVLEARTLPASFGS